MPEHIGIWRYYIKSNIKTLDGIQGKFECIFPDDYVKGPVEVVKKTHFAYRNGEPFYPFGTTAYVWNYQEKGIQGKTYKSLGKSPFNKIRMCIFPKYYTYNHCEPERTPFQRINGKFDFKLFDCEFFTELEKQFLRLQNMNIQIDLILFHPYDKWGFSKMPEEVDLRYVSSVVARFSAFRNVWWSVANEFNLLEKKRNVFWDRVFNLISEEDPYHHLCSIHNWYDPIVHEGGSDEHWYDHKKEWVTHASIQTHNMKFIPKWLKRYGKPILVDECGYEGNIDAGWGNLTAKKVVERFWSGVVCGAYVTHGETYLDNEGIIWWSHGGVLKGQSVERIAFLKKIIEDGKAKRLTPFGLKTYHWDTIMGINEDKNYILMYFGEYQPKCKTMDMLPMLPTGKSYVVDIIDTWNMTIEKEAALIKKDGLLALPGLPYIALRLIVADDEQAKDV